MSAAAAKQQTVAFACNTCGGTKIETCLPAYFKTNDDLTLVSVDYESEALSYFCGDCNRTVTVRSADGRTHTGRWGS